MISCAHCGRECGDYKGGYATILGKRVCHPNEAGRPGCYDRVTRRIEPLGRRLRRPDQCDVAELHDGILVLCQNPAVTEERVDVSACMDRGQARTLELKSCAKHRASEGAA